MLLKLVLHMLLVMGDHPPTSALPCAVTHVWVERAKAIAGLFYSTVDRITAQSTLAMRVVATVRTHFALQAYSPFAYQIAQLQTGPACVSTTVKHPLFLQGLVFYLEFKTL